MRVEDAILDCVGVDSMLPFLMLHMTTKSVIRYSGMNRKDSVPASSKGDVLEMAVLQSAGRLHGCVGSAKNESGAMAWNIWRCLLVGHSSEIPSSIQHAHMINL